MPPVSSDEEALWGVSDLSFKFLNPLPLQLMDSRIQTERKDNQRESEKPKPRKTLTPTPEVGKMTTLFL
jgi:hypothetical protein